ncbi:MAG: DNA alkylation repair protein [Candidatus Pacearchaeota archaeon]|jgi:3-methyladenine DNA glycosylase AlkD
MTYTLKRELKRLSNKQFAEDIQNYIKSPYEFYGIRVPEIRILAKRLHEEHSLKEFYNIFNKLWKSGYHEEMSLALYTLQLYEKDFDLNTWKFLKTKINDIKSWDQIDAISTFIIGKILLKEPKLEKEMIRLSKDKNFWMRRIAIVSTLPLIKNGEIRLTMKFAEKYVYDKEPYIQKATGWMLREAAKQKPELVKRFVLRHINMPPICFSYATERDLKGLRRIREMRKRKQ